MGWIGNAPTQGQISGGSIQDGTIDTIDLKDKAVTATKLGDTAIPDKLGYTPPTIGKAIAVSIVFGG